MFLAKTPGVLIVEDDPALRGLYKAMLQMEGFTVNAVEDGLDALRQIEVEVPAAVVLDLGLPRLGGRDVSREIMSRIETREIPIVIITGQEASDLDPRQFACILRKPIDPSTLVNAVRDCLRKASA
jgi:DNA-binding response OmpR family regulator